VFSPPMRGNRKKVTLRANAVIERHPMRALHESS
jgi:hypothetical protein